MLKTLEKIYYLRVAFGFFAALVCVGYGVGTGTVSNSIFDARTFFNGSSLAIVIYLLSYYAIKGKFKTEVQKPAKLVTAGIGIYWLSWIVFWVFLYTLIAGPAPLAV